MKDSTGIHLKWTVGVLLAALILMTTAKWGGVPDLVSRVMFALALSSLVLSILVIVYTFVRHSSLGETLAELRRTSDVLRDNAQELDQSTKELRSLTTTVPELIEDVGARVDETRKVILEQVSVPQPQSASRERVELTDEEVDKFLKEISYFGEMCLYIAQLAVQSGSKDVSLEEIDEIVGGPFRMYAIGFYQAADGIGIVSAFADLKTLRIDEIHPALEGWDGRKALIKTTELIVSNWDDPEKISSTRESTIREVEAVEEYFQ